MLNSPPSGGVLKNDYLERVLKARVYDVAIESPLELAPALSKRLRNRLYIKREDLQPVFSFKLRGAYNKMAGLPRSRLDRGVIAASAGNHAQGVALAAPSSCRSPRHASRSMRWRRAARRCCCMATHMPTRTPMP
jgi:hypothetical protein